MFKPRLRSAALAAILPALLFVAGCKDYSEQIAAVQQTAVRSIANHGETRNTLSSKPLGEYVQRDMMNDADVSWSAEGTTLDDGTEAVAHARLDRRRVGDVATHEAMPCTALECGEIREVAGVGEEIERDDGCRGVGLMEVMHEVRADEAGAAGDQNLHRTSAPSPRS